MPLGDVFLRLAQSFMTLSLHVDACEGSRDVYLRFTSLASLACVSFWLCAKFKFWQPTSVSRSPLDHKFTAPKLHASQRLTCWRHRNLHSKQERAYRPWLNWRRESFGHSWNVGEGGEDNCYIYSVGVHFLSTLFLIKDRVLLGFKQECTNQDSISKAELCLLIELGDPN